MAPSPRSDGLLARGFKAKTEAISANIRGRLGLQASDPLCPTAVASHLAIRIVALDDVPGFSGSGAHHLLTAGADDWSALSLTHLDVSVIVVNPTHSPERHASDLMHELAHFVLGHHGSRIVLFSAASLWLRVYDDAQEQEADWLAGALLLPRRALEHYLKQKWTPDQITQHFGTSVEMYRFRVNVTGVSRQFASQTP